ncbi:MAG: MFS transporter [Myxococcota bacterium]
MPYQRILAALVLTTLTDSFAEEFLQPLLVVLLEQRGVSAFLIGLTTSSGDLGVLVAAPFVPALVRAVSPVAYVRYSLLVLAGGVLLFPLFPHVYAWIALDFAFGVVTVGYFVLSDTLVNAAAEDSRRGRLLAAYMLAESLGAILGPLALSQVGVEGMRPFVIAASIMLLGIAPWFFLGDVHAPDLQGGERVPFLATLRGAPFLLGVAAAGAFFDDVPASLLPVFALDLGLSETLAIAMLSVLAAGTVVFQLPAGWLADRMDRSTFLGLASGSIAILALLLTPALGLPWLLWPLLLGLGGLFNGVELLGLALLGERSSLGNLAAINAAATMVGGVSSFVAPPVTGLLMDRAGAIALPGVIAATAVALLLASVYDGSRRRRISKASRGST